MDSIISHRKRTGKEDIIDMRLLEQAYGSDYPNKVPSHPIEMNMYVDPTIISKTMVLPVDREERLSHLSDDHLSD